MGRASTRENKSIYQLSREKAGLTREQAGDLLDGINPERIERIESGKSEIRPDEVIKMAAAYQDKSLCNHHCAKVCPIGKQYVPEIQLGQLPQIVMGMISSLNTMEGKKNRLIEIAADGKVSDDQIEDFIDIQDELERISIATEAMQLWAEQMLSTGAINKEKYEKIRNSRQ